VRKRKIVAISMDGKIADLVKKSDHKILGTWAADCAQRVLHYFEDKKPDDNRPRKAIEDLRKWVSTGIFKMADVRHSSLSAHAAARDVESDDVARSAARSAGQAMATAHVSTHSIAAALYAATVIRDVTNSMDEVEKERNWQYKHLIELLK
jgi:hypothetical protein